MRPTNPGLSLSVFQWGQDHRHDPPFHTRERLGLSNFLQVFHDPCEDFFTDLRVSHLTTPEHHRQFDFVAFLQEPPSVSDLEVVIMVLDTRPELHFLDPDGVLLFPCLTSLPIRLVLVLPVVHHFDHGWTRVGSDLNQIHRTYFGPFPGLVDRDDADLLTVVLNQPDGADPDLVVDTNSVLADVLSLLWSLDVSPFRASSCTSSCVIRTKTRDESRAATEPTARELRPRGTNSSDPLVSPEGP